MTINRARASETHKFSNYEHFRHVYTPVTLFTDCYSTSKYSLRQLLDSEASCSILISNMSVPENNFSQFLSKKAYEICYALFRVTSQVKHPALADHLEKRGLDLLESALSGDSHGASLASRTMEYLLRIGADVNILNSNNVQVIIHELGQFNSAIVELEKSAKALPVNLDDVFSKLPMPVENRMAAQTVAQESVGEVAGQAQSHGASPGFHASGENGGNGNGTVKSVIRKSAILEVIRQNGNCRLKEIQDVLPDTSERTIRYDIQNLIEQGLVERIGNGGPATYYNHKR